MVSDASWIPIGKQVRRISEYLKGTCVYEVKHSEYQLRVSAIVSCEGEVHIAS